METSSPPISWLEASGPRPRRLGRALGLAALLACTALAYAGCSDDANPLAPYEGQRPLDLLRVTQSFTPEIQWVGGRVAAVGVNRGTRAALDSTLVWIMTAPDNSIGSFVTFGEGADRGLVESLGGTPLDSLAHGETYTFWLAEASALAAGLDSALVAPAAFADTTITMQLFLRAGIRGGVALFEVSRDQRLTEERYTIRWTPEDVRFRQVAIRNASAGGYQNLIWHIDVPEGQPGEIAPPLVIGSTPPGTREVVPFAGFEPPAPGETVYTLWATTEGWNGSFGTTAPGYAFMQIRRDNF